jgi:hypothetical protein
MPDLMFAPKIGAYLVDDTPVDRIVPMCRVFAGGKCLDVLVRSGIASARTLEARIADDSSRKKSA